MLLSREDKDLGVASHAPPGSQASPRGEAKDSALLPSRDADILVPPELKEAHARIKISERNINNLRNADDTTLMAESEEK